MPSDSGSLSISDREQRVFRLYWSAGLKRGREVQSALSVVRQWARQHGDADIDGVLREIESGVGFVMGQMRQSHVLLDLIGEDQFHVATKDRED